MRKIKKYFIIILLSIFTLTTVETSSLNFSAYSDYSVDELRSARFAKGEKV